MDDLFPAAVRARMPEADDQPRWLSAARRGDPAALDEMFRSHQAQVYALCTRLLGSADDAEDALQASFIAAFRALPSFRAESSVRTWLYRIAVRESLRIAGKRRREPSLGCHAEPSEDSVAPVHVRLAVRSALERLRPHHRAVLVLRYWEDLSYREIAQVLGVPVPVVSMRLNRARAEFQRCYEAEP